MNLVLWLGCAVSAVAGGVARLLTDQRPDDAITIWLSQANQPLVLVRFDSCLCAGDLLGAREPTGLSLVVYGNSASSGGESGVASGARSDCSSALSHSAGDGRWTTRNVVAADGRIPCVATSGLI